MLNQGDFKIKLSDLLKDCVDHKRTSEYFAEKMAMLITDYIQSAEVNAGIPVATAGSPTAQTETTTGPGTLS